jgi:pilus assembly protein CpaF
MTLSPAELSKLKDFLKAAVNNHLAAQSLSDTTDAVQIRSWIEEAYVRTKLQLDADIKVKIFKEVIAEVVGYGPLQPLLEDPENSEIMVLGPSQVYVERQGLLLDTNITFDDETHLMRIIDRILHPLGRQVNIDAPTADARLPDGSRVNVVIPPVSIQGPCLTIRKFLKSKFSAEQFIALESMTEHMAEFLQACVVARLNIMITGNTSSGKTTLLNIFTGYIPGNERIVTIEDAAELSLKQKYTVPLETKPPNVDGLGTVNTRDLVRNALRMRPDRIIVGEVRGAEALDMLQAMNTGHDGSLTTLHANSPRDAIARLETMSMMAELEIPLMAIRSQIASAIDLIVHMDRLTDGTRKIVKITEVPRMEGEIVTLSDIFRFDATGADEVGNIQGEMRATGLRPVFSPRLEVAGFKLGGEIFGA